MTQKWGPLIIAVLVVAVLSGIAYRMRLIPQIDDTDPDTESTLSFAVEMVYEDGTTRTIEPDRGGLLSVLKPLTILDDTGKVIIDINYLVTVQTSYTGDFYAGSIQGTMTTQVNDATQDIDTFDRQGSFESGEVVRVRTVSLSHYLLRDWGKVGSNTLRVVCQVTVEVVFEDGSTDSMAGQGGFVVNYTEAYDSGITAISVTVSPSFLY